jgi:hypothetical protein
MLRNMTFQDEIYARIAQRSRSVQRAMCVKARAYQDADPSLPGWLAVTMAVAHVEALEEIIHDTQTD